MAFDLITFRLPSSLAPIATAALLTVLFMAAGFDIAQRKVPNALIIGGLSMALAFAATSGFTGIGHMAMGVLVALIILVPVYASGLMGAGDVKLISVVGGFLGVHQLLFALLCIFVAGGFLAAFYLMRTRFSTVVPGMPYAVAVFSGVVGYLATLP